MAGNPVISLFSGAGGLDLGVEDAGGDVVALVEPDDDCVSTLRVNGRFFPSIHAIIKKSIEDVSSDEILSAARLKKGEVTLLIGGPPCQPFSKAGYWLQDRRKGTGDPRATLLQQFIRVLRRTRPSGFLLENVASLIHPGHRATFDVLIETVKRAGYAITWRLIHAVQYGVPQTRARIFVIGLRGKIPPNFPEPTHWWLGDTNESHGNLKAPETAGRWIGNLDNADFAEAEEVVRGRWEHFLKQIPPGWNYKHFTSWAGCPNPIFVTETKYWTFLLKLSPFRPSWTIQSTPGPWTGPFHWESRRLRIPELAALQTFPRKYKFVGSYRSRRQQIGNAVPCLLGSKIAAALLSDILGTRVNRHRRLRYMLTEGYHFRKELKHYQGSRW